MYRQSNGECNNFFSLQKPRKHEIPFCNAKSPVNEYSSIRCEIARLCNSRRYSTLSSFGTDIRNVEWRVTTAFGARCKTYPLCDKAEQDERRWDRDAASTAKLYAARQIAT